VTGVQTCALPILVRTRSRFVAVSNEPTAGLWNIAADDPGRIALVDPDGREVSYGELTAAADRYGRGMQAMGLRPGDSVVMMLHNTAELVAFYFAAFQTGTYIVAANWHLTGPEIAYILKDSEAKIFLAGDRFAEAATIAADEAGVPADRRFSVGDIDGFRPLSELGAGEAGRPDIQTTGAPMLYTSGTTGKPKGVKRPLTGANPSDVPWASSGFFGMFRIVPFDNHVHICGSPLYHTAVLNFVTISIQLGHTAVLMDRWDPEQMIALIEKYKVTHSHMVPTQFNRLLALPEDVRKKYDVSSLRCIIHGAAPCPKEEIGRAHV
jgi:long-chain acyl-CoA synthetase